MKALETLLFSASRW